MTRVIGYWQRGGKKLPLDGPRRYQTGEDKREAARGFQGFSPIR